MRLLGAVLAGGASRRFGSDKAAAEIAGESLLGHAVRVLSPQVGDIVLCGCAHPSLPCLADRPHPGLGPLGGLNAAMHHALTHGFDAVISVPVDVYPLPADLPDLLGGGGAKVIAGQRSIGMWPAELANMLDGHLADGHRSIRSWLAACGAQDVRVAGMLHNINTLEDHRRASSGEMPAAKAMEPDAPRQAVANVPSGPGTARGPDAREP